MKLASGKRIGQSQQELAIAVFFSFFLHAAIIALALVIRMAITVRVFAPPSYNVKLVGLPQDLAPSMSETPAQPPAAATKPPAKKAEPRPAKPAAHKGAMPEFTQKQAKPAPRDQEETEPAPAQQAASAAKAQGNAGGVAVASSSGEFKFPQYLMVIRQNIERNWNPPPGAVGMKAKVQFTVLRSGRVGDAKLEASSGNFYFDQAAVRAILLSSPFPPMPDGFYKESENFSVDLMEKE